MWRETRQRCTGNIALRDQQFSHMCLYTGNTWLFTGSVRWWNALDVWLWSPVTTFLIPEFLITGRHSQDKSNTDDGERNGVFAFPLSHVFLARSRQQVASQLWLNESPDLRNYLLYYLQYWRLMCFLFIFRSYIKLLISQMLMKCADVCMYCCFADWTSGSNSLMLLGLFVEGFNLAFLHPLPFPEHSSIAAHLY